VSEWTRDNVADWLKENDFASNTRAAFFKAKIHGKELLELNDEKLSEMGIDSEARRERLLKEVEELKVAVDNINALA
jgi:SAM domain (Sterile alpha motif)